MTDKPQPSDASNPSDLDQVQEYQRLILAYESLDEQVDNLLAEYNGATENMPETAYHRYRELARRRDFIYHQMKALERQLFSDDDAS